MLVLQSRQSYSQLNITCYITTMCPQGIVSASLRTLMVLHTELGFQQHIKFFSTSVMFKNIS